MNDKATISHVPVIRRRLLDWFRRNHRPLPWRVLKPGKPDPYHVLVSEAMLQQTQVGTVVEYFRRFVARWPTVRALAAADEQQVLRMWQGLGYYRRARYLYAAAQKIANDYGGRVPDTVEALITLRGIGRYSAGAIASIAYGRPVPVLDGNVARVLARCLAVSEPLDQQRTQAALWAFAEQLVSRRNPGAFNQALMELGALICKPHDPVCVCCPLRQVCQARLSDRVNDLPQRGMRRKPRRVEHQIVAVRRATSYLFEQRSADGLWSRMWQLPTLELSSRDADLEDWFRHRFGLITTKPMKLMSFSHQTTHRTIRFVLWTVSVRGGRLRPKRGIWRSLQAIDDLPLANPQRRAISLVQTCKVS